MNGGDVVGIDIQLDPSQAKETIRQFQQRHHQRPPDAPAHVLIVDHDADVAREPPLRVPHVQRGAPY